MTAHLVLRRIGSTSLFAYSAGGAAIGVFRVVAGSFLVLSGQGHGLIAEIAMGACAGFFYRLLAGARPPVATAREFQHFDVFWARTVEILTKKLSFAQAAAVAALVAGHLPHLRFE